MINGLYIDVTSEELKTMLLGRLKYHQEKVVLYKEQVETMLKVDEKLKGDREAIGKTSTASPVDTLEQAVRKHENQVVYYKFMAEHVVQSEVYRLSENDLQRLGISGERYYG